MENNTDNQKSKFPIWAIAIIVISICSLIFLVIILISWKNKKKKIGKIYLKL